MHSRKKLSIVVPTYNEEKSIKETLGVLSNQSDFSGRPLDKSVYQIIVVNNNSIDNTVAVVREFSESLKELDILIINESKKGVVAARIAGYNYVLESKTLNTPYLSSVDADINVHQHFVSTVIQKFDNTDVDVLSVAGCFPDSLWKKVPTLENKYIEELGTIFFNNITNRRLNLVGKYLRFTEQLFFDFGRHISDGCFAIRGSAYIKGGGYRQEFRDITNKKDEVFGEGWRLSFILERLGSKFEYVNSIPYESSPRRLLEEPDKFLSANSYEGTMDDLRNITEDNYEILDKLAEYASLAPVKRYIVDYYILLRCITRPDLIDKNIHYFGDFGVALKNDIVIWWKDRRGFKGYELFDFSKSLGDTYAQKIMDNMPKLKVF